MKKIEEALRILGVIADTHKLFFAGAVTKDARAELAQLKENLQLMYDLKSFCPICGKERGYGHTSECWLKEWVGGE